MIRKGEKDVRRGPLGTSPTPWTKVVSRLLPRDGVTDAYRYELYMIGDQKTLKHRKEDYQLEILTVWRRLVDTAWIIGRLNDMKRN